MAHHIHTTTTLRTTTSFLLVLLINQHTIKHHTLATLHHHTLATLHQYTNNHLGTFSVTMDTHYLPSSHQLAVHIIPASHTLEFKCNNQVIKVTFVASVDNNSRTTRSSVSHYDSTLILSIGSKIFCLV